MNNTCEHENITLVGWDERNKENYKKYLVNRETSKKYSVRSYEVSRCDECGALLNDYQDGIMTPEDIASWIDDLTIIKMANIISFVEKIE